MWSFVSVCGVNWKFTVFCTTMDCLKANRLLDCTQQVLLISAVAQHPETRLSVCVCVSVWLVSCESVWGSPGLCTGGIGGFAEGESPSLTPSFRTGLPPCESVIVIQAFTPYNFLHILAHTLTHLDRVLLDQRQKQGSSGMAASKPWTLVFREAVIRMLQCRLKALRRLFQRQPERFPCRTVSTVLWTVIGFPLGSKADVYLRKACIRHSLTGYYGKHRPTLLLYIKLYIVTFKFISFEEFFTFICRHLVKFESFKKE